MTTERDADTLSKPADSGRADAKEYLDNCVNALDHIARTARNCRVTSKRLTWIASRAESAINSDDAWRDAPVPQNGASALMRARVRIKELEAALAAQGQGEAEGWRPIETAPKDARILLCREGDECSHAGFWQESVEDGVDYMGADAGFVDVDFQNFCPPRSFGHPGSHYPGRQPTLWMPLPTPPAKPAGVPDGWRLVPVESTSEMDIAGADIAKLRGAELFGRNDAKRVWSAMLAAAPSAPEGGEVGL